MKRKILFVCLGNICRSPAAEAVMKKQIEERGLSANFEIDSAGILSVHQGEKADSRMRQHAARRGYEATSISRQVKIDDFDRFDLIIGMDDSNIDDLNDCALTAEHKSKIRQMTEYSKKYNYTHIPDPYYGGTAGFELVLDLLEDACTGLLESFYK
ncbi:MAG: low molecular weight phosphotyrosine protein phosphatase [Prevotellaceae bacterium]|jgi:protein-tyrosine phosphatase|nr:low molecular weight phosphotyrosine protein phosphatase [Prevotellaceae bacterium]